MVAKSSSMIAWAAGSRWAVPLRSILTGFGVFFLGSLSDVWLEQHTRSLLIALIDDALVGLGTGLLVFFYERRQRQSIIRKLEVIRLMNHHVRNSLQVISCADSVPQRGDSPDSPNAIQDAVERIEWALREVLPGQREDINDLSFDLHPNERSAQKPKIVA